MSVRLNEALCRRCGACLKICPGDLWRPGPEGLPRLEEPERCWACAACLKVCPEEAIGLYLNPSLGGGGLIMTVVREKAGEEAAGGLDAPEAPGGPDAPRPPARRRLRWRVRRGPLVREILTDPARTGGY
jgi:adenylylsulfate reductase subunit B